MSSEMVTQKSYDELKLLHEALKVKYSRLRENMIEEESYWNYKYYATIGGLMKKLDECNAILQDGRLGAEMPAAAGPPPIPISDGRGGESGNEGGESGDEGSTGGGGGSRKRKAKKGKMGKPKTKKGKMGKRKTKKNKMGKRKAKKTKRSRRSSKTRRR